MSILKNNQEKFQAFASVSPVLREGIARLKDKLVMGVNDRYMIEHRQSGATIANYLAISWLSVQLRENQIVVNVVVNIKLMIALQTTAAV